MEEKRQGGKWLNRRKSDIPLLKASYCVEKNKILDTHQAMSSKLKKKSWKESRRKEGKEERRKGPKEEEYKAWGSIDVFNISTFALHKQIRTYI